MRDMTVYMSDRDAVFFAKFYDRRGNTPRKYKKAFATRVFWAFFFLTHGSVVNWNFFFPSSLAIKTFTTAIEVKRWLLF